MSKSVMSEQWLADLPTTHPDIEADAVPLAIKYWRAYSAAVSAADAASGSKSAVRAAAMNLFRESGDPAVAKLDALAENIAKITAELADMQATYDDAVDAATAAYQETAQENATKNAGALVETVKATRAKLNSALSMVFGVNSLKDIEDLPSIPQRKRETDNDEDGKPKGWSPRLASATVNGVAVPNAEGKEFPTMETVKVALGISKPTREFSAFLLDQNGGARELDPEGTTIKIKVNSKDVTIVLVPREKSEKSVTK